MEKEDVKVLAIDFGASSGRAMLASYNGQQIVLQEIHRFSNDPVFVGKTMYWDVLRLFYEIKQSLVKVKPYGKVDSIAVDTWGVDFGLIDKDGALLENPVHYRDSRTMGMMQEAFSVINEKELYEITGNQFMEINTLFQLLSLKKYKPTVLQQAGKLLFMPDLFSYFLCGEMVAEKSIASTSQLLDERNGKWSKDVMKKFSLPKKIFPPLVEGGTVLGKISHAVCEELNITQMNVVSVTGHDTQCAIAAVPAQEEHFIFISCGTWSLLGTELKKPIMNEKARVYHITNEQGMNGTYSFLKNIIGLWLVQESRREWIRQGKTYSFGELEEMANEAKPLQCFIDPDDPVFVAVGNIPERIRQYCKNTNQYIPKNDAEIVRCINESLALKYRYAVEQIVDCTEKNYQHVHIVGGGCQSRLLCQMTANALGRIVNAGPIESTAFGNAAIQLKAQGKLQSLDDIRKLIAQSVAIETYKPQDDEIWEEAYQKFCRLL